MTSTELVRYDSMCRAITACHAVDEVLDIHDKARALEVYALQARNIEAERKACDVRLRAERRAGELLKELARATPQTANPSGSANPPDIVAAGSPYRHALDINKLPERTAQRYQQLAEVPAEVFEAAMNGNAKPSTRAIIEAARDPVPPMDPDALWMWGRLRDFEQRYLDADPATLLHLMTETMQADVRRIAPVLVNFLGAMLEAKP